MRTANTHPGFSLKIVALALLAAFGSVAHAADDEIAALIRPDSSVSVGAAGLTGTNGERSWFGQYSGLRRDDTYLLLDIDVIKRDAATGTWTTFQGRDLGLDTREIRFGQQKQGDWKYSFDYNEMVRHDPRTINTGVTGTGSNALSVTRLATPGSGDDLNLDLKRKIFTVGVEKWLSNSLQFEASFRNEDKNGARLFGNGFQCTSGAAPSPTCPASGTQWALLMLPEPINSTTQQFEARLNFSTEKLFLSGGYYGSFYNNQFTSMGATVDGNLGNPVGNPMSPALTPQLRSILQLPMALPPDNQAHQIFLSGNYAFTPTTKANFKYAFTHATQTDSFAAFTGAPAGRSNLGGEVDSVLYQAGITSRPIPKLSLLANVRYEDRNDKTPIAYYNLEGTKAFTNGNYSPKRLVGKAEASYQLPAGFRGTVGADYESIDRGMFVPTNSVAGLSGLRQKTEEAGYRLELRRAMTETLSGAVAYQNSDRSGGTWLKPNTGLGVTPTADGAIYSRTAIFPMSMVDRNREKIRASADWSATERLTLQFMAEWGEDKFSAPTTKGLRASYMGFYGIDAVYALSDDWRLTGFWSRGDQTTHIDHSTGYMAALRNRTETFGLGINGKPTGRLTVGGDLLLSADKDKYQQDLDASASAANVTLLATSGGLPDVTFRQFTARMFGKYAIEKNSAVRVDFIHQRTKLNEWTWGYNGTPFVYSDNTTVYLNPKQSVSYLGATYIVALP
ncbi:MtrB/PioB family decaheme-associated outer membrane protein [uncultured Zoogloea sp.]|uniref:MtrB/PioB family decaheme-associated outer membrane protein n=1 Tax=uncultured Zoogloea sp. TaxID=160237 RepID=UPI002604B126|nr:MtrB/PioB family decaheme-associated outer membrane protein [uncultured Zoogloea sp.]